MLFGSALVISALHAASVSLATHPGIIGGVATIISHIDLSPLSQYLSGNNSTLHEKIIQAENNKQLYIHRCNETSISISYNENTFDTDLTNITSIYFPDSTHLTSLITQTLKSSKSIDGTFEIHDIIHKDKDVTITSVTFSPIKTDKIWNLYFTTWGNPYVDLHISKKDIILCN